MRRFTIVLLSAFLLAASPKLTFEEAVQKCVKIVRARSTYSQFDAYVTSQGEVRYFGAPAERFQFEKCLDQHGHPLEGQAR